MNRSRRGRLRSPSKLTNPSSSSLHGMERPVRSFKSFIRSVPPNPTNNKPLPPVPSKEKSSPQSMPSASASSSPETASSINPRIAPVEWFNSDPSSMDSSQSAMIYSHRTYCPLLPEPSPDITEPSMEFRLVPPGTNPSQKPRLMPIYERRQSDLGPPGTPPKSPLPTPPIPKAGPDQLESRRSPRPTNISPVGGGGHTQPINTSYAEQNSVRESPHPTSATSTASRISQTPTQEKARASLGLGSPVEQPTPLRKQPWAMARSSPLAEDTWEDEDVDDKTRQLSFAQDYHDLLIDQYRGMGVRPEEKLKQGLATKRNANGLEHHKPEGRDRPNDHELFPQSLSWRQSANGPPPRSASKGRKKYSATEAKASHNAKSDKTSRNVPSWVPRRLGATSKRDRSGSTQTEPLSTNENHQDRSNSPTARSDILTQGSGKRGQKGDSRVDRILNKDLRFPTFYPRSKPLRFREKTARSDEEKEELEPPLPKSPPKSSDPILHLPGGLAIVTSSPSPAAEPESKTATEPPKATDRPKSGPNVGSCDASEAGNSPPSNSSDHRSSYNSLYSNPPTSRAQGGVRSALNKFRISKDSSHSPQYSSSSRLLAQESPQSPTASSFYHHSSSKDEGEERRPGFLEKAREARRKHNREVRQEKLKKSIRVLGPTDPSVVGAYVKKEGDHGRVPGYMARKESQ
ncbi:hypothetical protein K469DRAFT_686196 [Zopfia rhizophila CBS 207.26]|uniref:Uncharacterized protein n=1 Tax=Zopfia rhizophila CBS 207.26 TaxID=1314779 RepID=A0A6A6E8R9_9PEZI|nr:hypothetical protein K469DRAFT_686196 [Zopfia rhizophila CBS 207.26]